MRLQELPLVSELKSSQSLLLAGAGGGFDLFSTLPLYFMLKSMGKEVTIANLSFTFLEAETEHQVLPGLWRISDSDSGMQDYHPERTLKRWFTLIGEEPDIYAFPRAGTRVVKNAYKWLVETHKIDAVVLVDGGTDILMQGDEESLGTPVSDATSLVSVASLENVRKYVLCLGFGVDYFHGVSHYLFLQNLAGLAAKGAFLGTVQLLQEMPEVQRYLQAVDFANREMAHYKSIVCNSIASALKNEFGDVHATERTSGSELFINALMTLYWCFHLDPVAEALKYRAMIEDTETFGKTQQAIWEYRKGLERRPARPILL